MSDEFRAYKSDPTSDNLIRLLRIHQDRVYRLCLQVLRRPHDAEDAAQEVLVRIADGVRGIDDADAFRRWVWRVSLNAALESARKAARRRVHESRAAMKPPAAAPLDDESRRALFEAIARLDDAPRSLLLDHYFEGETLETLGSREGVSPQAVSKRLERAREELCRASPALGAAFDLGRLFDVRGAAIPDLVSGPVLAKVAAIAGGVAMSTKSVLVPGIIAAALVMCLGAGMVAINFRVPGIASLPIAKETPSHAESSSIANREPIPPSNESFASPVEAGAAPPAASTPLRQRLERFRTWWKEKEAALAGRRPDPNQHDKDLWEHVTGLRALILADPDGFMKFLRDPDNEGLLMDLTQMNPLVQTDRPYVSHLTPFGEYPLVLREGLLDLLQTGTARQRVATFRLLDGFPEIPDAFKNVYLASVDDSNPDVQAFAIRAVGLTVPITPALLSKFSALGTGSESAAVRQAVVAVMASTPGAASETFLLNRMQTETDGGALYSIIFSVERRIANRGGEPIQEVALARALSAVVSRFGDVRWSRLLHAASHLSGDRLKPILLQIMAKSADLEYRGRLQKAIEMIDQGGSSRDDLMKILEPPR